jgi:uncharacterized protein (DUF924 family)
LVWFGEAGPGRWFNKDAAFDDTVRQRFRALHEALATSGAKANAAEGFADGSYQELLWSWLG